MVKVGDVNIKDLNHVMIIVAYDVPDEGMKALKRGQRNFLMATRRSLTNRLYSAGCVPIQQSLYRVPDHADKELSAEAVNQIAEEFKERYKDPTSHATKAQLPDLMGSTWNAHINVYPVALDDVGYESMTQMQTDGMLLWVSEVTQVIESKIDEKEVKQSMLNRYHQAIGHIEAAIEQFYGKARKDHDPKVYATLMRELAFAKQMLADLEMELGGDVKLIEDTKRKKPGEDASVA
jgi:hypothetical protein